MGKVGFILLLVGGILVLLMRVNIALDVTIRGYIALIINTFVAPQVGIPNLGDIIADLLYLLTLFGGVCIVAGALLWFAAGHGCLAFLGKTLAGIGGFSVTYQVVFTVIAAYQTGVFDEPLHEIVAYFASLGLGFAAVFLVFVGMILGASRRPKAKPAPQEPTPQPA
jgi:hypothetical protein